MSDKADKSYDILMVDDDVSICRLLSGLLEDEGYQVASVYTSEDAFSFFEDNSPKLAIVDVWLNNSENDGLKILEVLTKDYADCMVLMMSGHATIDIAVKAIQLGANDFIAKPFRSEVFLNYIRRLLEERRLRYENRELKRLIAPEGGVLLKGDSREVRVLRRELDRVSKVSSYVLLEGDMGVGKSSLARYIHNNSRNGSFVSVNYLSESGGELFSQIFEQGLDIQKKSELEGGTLVLEDVDKLPMEKQKDLLNGLSRHQKEDWGERGIYRLIVTSRRDIHELVKQGQFDESLYYRLSVIRVVVPNLSARRLDIGAIVKQVIKERAGILGRRPRVMTSEAISVMQAYHWRGNMHRLVNIVERMLIADGEPVPVEGVEVRELIRDSDDSDGEQGSEDIPVSNLFGKSLREAREEFEALYLRHHLANCEGNVSKLSVVCGMERTALYRKMSKLSMVESENEELKA